MNFPNFPLYESLKKNTPEESNVLTAITELEKNEIIKKIKVNKINEWDEIIYALIKSYAIDHGVLDEFPYLCKKLKTGLKVDLDTLPSRLQQILLNFVRIK